MLACRGPQLVDVLAGVRHEGPLCSTWRQKDDDAITCIQPPGLMKVRQKRLEKMSRGYSFGGTIKARNPSARCMLANRKAPA